LQLERGQKHAVLRTLGLLAADPHLEGLIGRTLEVVREQLGAQAVTLWRLDAVGEFLWCAAGPPSGPQLGEEPPRVAVADLPAWKILAETRRAVRIMDPQADLVLAGRLTRVAPGSRELIVVPLAAGSAPAGLLVAECDPAPRHAEERMEL